ncbi:uncharacterized protein BT62DRAFT_955500 [Guyanagaster necrorhizus]|uniref:Proteophosphoglycan ppg4 n=1 Tax=Guyanagaster necrorhizus TaxID=856835 RepID=A0A9P7VII5_9AGAR|nr:uncharacterized protein BT62DRAFT_955500 [Guyanagaster necrorhizus MCA 3950]KAG7441688.1 hypothetical protein BT62DRAFT_955500 [Guyanagaster necrorhizus MCA 3950]
MRFFSRLLRIQPPEQPETSSSSPGASTSPADTRGDNDHSENTSPHRMDSEGYPAWLPQRPPPPAPASTVRSSTMDVTTVQEAGPSEHPPSSYLGGRRATPRSVRIVSLQDSAYGVDSEKERRVPTDHTRVGSGSHYPRVWSRATATGAAAPSPTVFSTTDLLTRGLQPKFRSRGLNIDLLRNPSPIARIYFYLFRLFIFAHLFLQTFFDFNAVFIIIQVAKHPNPEAPGVPGSGKNWSFGAAAYITCWFLQIAGVFLVYELLYSFVRRWRVKRPSIYPIYLSSPAFNFVSILSFRNFCFLHYLRYSAFRGSFGSIRDGLSETFWFYAQNLPTVALLLPRAAISVALLLGFWEPDVGEVALADAGIDNRDGTFFRGDGALTDYARGVLLANAAWTAWRTLVLFLSWIGLWAVSGHGCAGFCGPRDRWEEEDAEKTVSVYSDNPTLAADALPWTWRECTKTRIQEAYDFCLTTTPPRQKELADTPEPFEGMDQIMAAAGLGGTVPQSRRGVLTDDFFRGPKGEPSPEIVGEPSTSGGPLRELPYPFTMKAAQVSSDDEKVPFPPSPSLPSEEKLTTEKETSATGGDDDADEEGEEEEEEEEEEEADIGHRELGVVGSDKRSSGRGSGSMSSLGHPVSSRYPFQFRRPARGTSLSSGSHGTPPQSTTNSNAHSIHSRLSQSTGNVESSDSHSPRSHYSTSSDAASPRSLQGSSVIPMPPRHPNRSRAGTVPSSPVPSSPSSPISFPRSGRPRARTRTSSSVAPSFGEPQPPVISNYSDLEGGDDSRIEEGDALDQPEPELPEAAESEDVVGLLTLEPSGSSSPRMSFIPLRARPSTPSHRNSSRSGSISRSNSQSGSSSSRSRAGSLSAVRSRTQSLIHNISVTSLELVQGAMRSRADSSMARLEEDPAGSATHSRSGSSTDPTSGTGSGSGGENWTFGHPMAWQRQEMRERRAYQQQQQQQEAEEFEEGPSHEYVRGQQPSPVIERDSESESSHEGPGSGSSVPIVMHESRSELSVGRTSTEQPYMSASSLSPPSVFRPRPRDSEGALSMSMTSSSHPDISTAAASFVTAPATIEGSTTEDSIRTVSTVGAIHHMVDRPHPSGIGGYGHVE